MHFCKLEARKQKSKPADSVLLITFVSQGKPICNLLVSVDAFLLVANRLALRFYFPLRLSKMAPQTVLSYDSPPVDYCVDGDLYLESVFLRLQVYCMRTVTRQNCTGGNSGLGENAGFRIKSKFISFNYLCLGGQRSAPKPRTSQARGTLQAMVKTNTSLRRQLTVPRPNSSTQTRPHHSTNTGSVDHLVGNQTAYRKTA